MEVVLPLLAVLPVVAAVREAGAAAAFPPDGGRAGGFIGDLAGAAAGVWLPEAFVPGPLGAIAAEGCVLAVLPVVVSTGFSELLAVAAAVDAA